MLEFTRELPSGHSATESLKENSNSCMNNRIIQIIEKRKLDSYAWYQLLVKKCAIFIII